MYFVGEANYKIKEVIFNNVNMANIKLKAESDIPNLTASNVGKISFTSSSLATKKINLSKNKFSPDLYLTRNQQYKLNG